MRKKPTILHEFGDPMSELNVQRRLQWLRERTGGDGIVFVPKDVVEADPAMKKAVEELDWMRLAE